MWSIQSSIFYLFWPTFFKNRGTGFCARFSCGECPKSLDFSTVLRDSKYQVLLRYARMCNRFEITRNQVYRKVPWVRIPPPPPIKPLKTLRFQGFFYSPKCSEDFEQCCKCSKCSNGFRRNAVKTSDTGSPFQKHQKIPQNAKCSKNAVKLHKQL